MHQCFAFMTLLTLCVGSAAAAQEPCQVRLILFLPSDVKEPAGYQERIDQIVAYSESFLTEGFTRWGHDNIVMPFRHTADGHAEVLKVRGKKDASQYSDASVRNEAIASAIEQNGLDVGRQIWWVMVYVGDPPKKFRVFRGAFDPKIGGWSVCNYNTLAGNIRPSAPLGEEFLATINLKAVIHELGHGFQLPHIGPRRTDNGGNSLMGPTHASFRKVASKRDNRVYLSEAAAALMSTHPAFRGVADARKQLPKVQLSEMKYAANSQDKTLSVSGRVKSGRKAVYAVVADESDARPGEYWTKTYVDKVDDDGRFDVTITEPSPTKGTLKIWFAFANGALTGNGKQSGKRGAVAKAYSFTNGRWNFR